MAVQEISKVNELTSDFLAKLRDEGDGPGGSPYGSRIGVLAGLMSEHVQCKTGTFTVDADGAANGVEVDLGMNVRHLVAFNETTLARYEKLPSLGATASFKQLTAGTLSLAANTFSFAKIDTTALKGFSLNAAEATLNDVWHYVALGV